MLAIGVKFRRQRLPVWAAWMMLSLVASLAAAQVANNPHWNKTACGTCHPGKPGPVAAAGVTVLCISCHDGVHAGDEAHPVGRAMTASLANPGWPTVNGTVQCLTCHDVKQQCDTAAERPEGNASFLRQAANDETQFCANCHREGQINKFNPHLMLAADQHTPIEQRCQVCHDKPMDNTAMTRGADASLRAEQVLLCKSCHPRHKDISTTQHVLAVIPPEMLAYMRAREMTGLLNSPSPDLIKELQAQHAKPTMMVPDAQGRVVCTTCHNPHEQGTFAPDSVLSDRSLRLMKGHLVTPTRSELFCHHCHVL
jgi:hypothetical protein